LAAMTTRTKLNLTSGTLSLLTMLNVFSKPLHIERFEWLLLIGIGVSLVLMFRCIKQLKQETPPPVSVDEAAERRRKTKRALIWMMVGCSAIGLCGPLWMPLTGTTLGPRGDFICGLITVAFICTIFGYRLRKL